EAAGELHSTKHPKRGLAEGSAGGPEDARLQIGPAAGIVVKLFAYGVVSQGVFGENAPGGRFPGRDTGIGSRFKIAMAPANLVVPSRHADVPVVTCAVAEFDDAEGLAYEVHAPALTEELRDLIVGHAVDLNIEILGRNAEERIAHGAAGHQAGEPVGCELTQDRQQPGRSRD